jgi:hypothetical protein
MKTPIIPIETFCSCETHPNNDFLLTGHLNLENANQDYKIAVNSNSLSEKNYIKNAIGLGPENTFNYVLESFLNKKQIKHETGVGYAYEIDSVVRFKKLFAIMHGTDPEESHYCNYTQPVFYCTEGAVNIIRGFIPDVYNYNLHFDNGILISTAPYIPSCLHIKENSLVGRFNQDLQNISFDDPDFIDYIGRCVSHYTKQLNLKSSKVSAKAISTQSIQFNPSSLQNIKSNTLVYDENTDTLKFYNGIKWRTVKWEDEENQE